MLATREQGRGFDTHQNHFLGFFFQNETQCMAYKFSYMPGFKSENEAIRPHFCLTCFWYPFLLFIYVLFLDLFHVGPDWIRTDQSRLDEMGLD